jgi:hypothetical protein
MGEETCPNSHKPPQVLYDDNHPLAKIDREEVAEEADISLLQAEAKEYHEIHMISW